MRQAFAQNRTFFFLYTLFFFIAVPVILLTEKISLHKFFNQGVRPAFNFFFEYVTYLGDGIFVVTIGVLLLIKNVRQGLTVLLAYSLSAGFTQGIKYVFFGDADRPQLVWEKEHLPPLNLVEGVDINIHHSFPSGHSTAAFALFFCLGFFSRKAVYKVIFFFVALTVAFSRVYLSQHFFEDITAGSLVALLFSFLVCWFFYFSSVAKKLEGLDKPLYHVFR